MKWDLVGYEIIELQFFWYKVFWVVPNGAELTFGKIL